MLWTKGQERIAREERERLAERYVTGVDAYVGGLNATGQLKPGYRMPGYVGRELSPVEREAAAAQGLARLIAKAGGNVERGAFERFDPERSN